MSVTDSQPAMLLLAQMAKILHNELTRTVHHHIGGTRDLRDIKKQLAKPLAELKAEFVECGYFPDPEAWEWSIKKRGEELEICARTMPGMQSRTQFIFGVPLPTIN